MDHHHVRLATRATNVDPLALPLGAPAVRVPGGFVLGFATRSARDDALGAVRRNLGLARATLGDPGLEASAVRHTPDPGGFPRDPVGK